MSVVASAALEQASAAWVQAYGSIGAILATLIVVAVHFIMERLRNRKMVLESKKTVAFVVERCVDEYKGWVTSVTNAGSRLTEETISLRHLDVPLERLLPANVGNHRFDSALIAMRKVNADVFIQIEKAKTRLEASQPSKSKPDLRDIAEELQKLADRAVAIRNTLPA